MFNPPNARKPRAAIFHSLLLLLIVPAILSSPRSAAQGATTITVDSAVKLSGAKRLGINMGAQDYYDSQQTMRNILFRNPGFEGEMVQSILHCKTVTATSCTDDNSSAYWGSNFFINAAAEFITGGAAGVHASVASSLGASGQTGVGATLNFAAPPPGLSAGDYVVVRMQKLGNAQAGWWTYLSGGASLASELQDLSPNSPGLQALRINAAGSGQYATVSSYADSSASQPFIQMKGGYTLFFRAKGTGGANQVAISLNRLLPSGARVPFFNQTTSLTTGWQDYSYYFQANDTGAVGTIALTFTLNSASMLLDDVSLTADAAPGNVTAYRNEVVSTLQALNPGVLRYMDTGASFGSSISNMIAPTFARQRAAYSAWKTESDDIPVGLHDFLVLCKTVGAEPWYTFPAGMSTQDMSSLMDYFGGSTSTAFGAKRAALGQSAPWTTVFPTIHLEFGNEVWNTAFGGENITDASSYGRRASALFAVARSSPSYSSGSFDLVLDGWATSPGWNQAVLAASANYDTIDAAPYLFYKFNDTSSTEAIFGPMFAQPELFDSVAGGVMNKQGQIAAAAPNPANLAVYEVNLSTNTGAASQSAINSTVPSVGAGLAVADHMLLMMRDLGITTQMLYSLGGFGATFSGTGYGAGTRTPLWGSVYDMGVTNRVRPTYLGVQLANSAILPSMITTTQSGANPTWNQPLSSNDNISLSGAHYIQSFAFTDGAHNNVILFNLHRTQALPVVFAGSNAPIGSSTITTLTAPSISSTNEQATAVAPVTSTQTLQAGASISLPPYSMTVISSAVASAPTITGVTASCAAGTLGAGGSTACTANVTGTGSFNSAVTWQASQGTVNSSGVYTAPSPLANNGSANITATSVQDTTQSSTVAVNLSGSAVTGVSVSCASASIPLGGGTSCAASVAGSGNLSSGVTWSTTAGSIDANGYLTAPSSGSSLVVQATSRQDQTRSGTQTITLLNPAPVLSVPVVTTTATTATISWTTNVPTRSGVDYGTIPGRGGSTTPYVYPPTSSPSFTLTGLLPATTYYYALFSSSTDNSQVTFANYSLTTAGAPPPPPPPPPPAGATPIANGFPYFTGSYGVSNPTDTVITLVPFWPAGNASNLQLVFGNTTLAPEYAGPGITIRASFEYPQGTIWPVYFNGQRDAQLAGGGVLVSDPTNLSVTAGTVGYVRVRVIRNPTSGPVSSLLLNYSCGSATGNQLAPNTTTRKGGNFDGCEYLTSQSGSDGVMTAGSTGFSSGSISLDPLYSVGQQITVSGAGPGGGLYTGTIVSGSGGNAILTPAASTSVTGQAWSYTGADKTSTASAYIHNYGGAGYAPTAIIGQATSPGLNSVTILGDSIGQGTGATLSAGSWPIQALNPSGVSNGLSTTIASSIPFVQMSQGGETIHNLETVHQFRFSQIPRTSYTLVQIGTNDSALPLAQQQADDIMLWNQIDALGSAPVQPTIIGARGSSTDNWLTTTNQTPDPGTHGYLEAMNAWFRDGAPIDNSSGQAVAIGASSATANRAAFYDSNGVLINAASGPAPANHPLAAGFIFDISPAVETSIGSGIWKVDPANRTVNDAVTGAGSTVVTSASANFTPADNGHYLGGPGIRNNTVITYMSPTQVSLSGYATVTASGVTLTIGGPYGKNTIDGLHPSAHGHLVLGQAAALSLNRLQTSAQNDAAGKKNKEK
ncbi:MAG TPA: hypothetical protein VGD59_06640 [Acidisarcina sp.]